MHKRRGGSKGLDKGQGKRRPLEGILCIAKGRGITENLPVGQEQSILTAWSYRETFPEVRF